MTEEEWLTPGDLNRHVEYLWALNLARKLRLFGTACCRQMEPWVNEPVLLDAIQRAEDYADGNISDSTIMKWRQKVNRWENERLRNGGKPGPLSAICCDISTVCLENRYASYTLIWRTLTFQSAQFGGDIARRGPGLADTLLRDIFGNPFRPVAFDLEWRTSSAVQLARGMYDARDFAPMPVLADALQDAGCEHADILAHCRGPGPHVRGCWVVDLVLGKE